MPSSDPQAVTVSSPEASDSHTGPRGMAASLVILLVGALTMFAVGRGAPAGGDLPLLPPLDGDSRVGTESLTIASTPPPSVLGPGVASPADRAPGYRIREGSAADVVMTLTTALGFTAGPKSRSDKGAYLIVDADSDRMLRVENSPGYPWSVLRGNPECFDDPDSSVSSDGTISCPAPSEASHSTGSPSGVSGEQVRCPPVQCPEGRACAQVCPEPEPFATPAQQEPFLELPDPQDTERLARQIIGALGVEVARSTLSVAPDGRSWQVLAELSVNGIPAVGMDTQLSIGGNSEVVAARGMIPTVELLGEYPLITADEALVRLREIHSPNNQAQFDGREPAAGAPEPALQEYASFPPDDSFVTAMRLVLLLQATAGGAYLVPAFQVDSSDGGAFTVPAAMDEHLTPT